MRQLSEVLPEALGRSDVLRAARALRVARRWESVVGQILAARSAPDRFDHGTLWVAVTTSVWAQEIRLRRESILQRLNEAAGERGLFQELRVTIQADCGSVRKGADAARAL
ncbi:MAG: DUF721 domain-containing protein [Fimbriimonadaceae bacterium]|nr:DUF721 domain-containing protein [Fimbriimonadaceae bacterium]